jgi:ribosomal protein L37E
MSGMSEMPIRKKALILVALVVNNLLGSLGLTIFVDWRFGWAILLPVAFALWLVMLRCERCGTLVYKNRMGTARLSYWGGFNPLRRRCTQCGFDFAQRSRGRDRG